VADSLLVALAGGAIGSALTTLSRYSAVPSEVRQHDRQIAEIDADLDRFAADEYARLRNVELPQLLSPQLVQTLTASGGNAMDSKTKAKQWALLISFSMQLYRDHENGRLADYREIIGSETRGHWLYRKLRRKPVAALKTPSLATTFLDRWKTLSVSTHEKAHMPDPRKRSIAQATQQLDAESERVKAEGRPVPPGA
jgi:hypothetical protein